MKSAQKKQVTKKLTKSQNKKISLEAEERLTRDEQIRVIQWLVELKSPQQIVGLIKDTFEKDISRVAVWKYAHSRKWRPILERLKARFERNIAKIPIANKSHRLRILQKVVDEGLTWSLKNITKDGDEIYELKLGAVTEAVKAAKEEVEGKVPLIDASTHLHFTNLKGEQLINEARRRGIPLPLEIERKLNANKI